MNDDGVAIFWMIVFLICVFLAAMGGCKKGSEDSELSAIEAGVAEYYIDKDNNKQFHYLPPCTHQQLPQRIYDDEEENGFRDVPYEGSE